MRTICIDSENKCHPVNDGTMTPVETTEFDGMCDVFVEGYCMELDENGNVVKRYPWKPIDELDAAQREYERTQLADYKAACERMGIVV